MEIKSRNPYLPGKQAPLPQRFVPPPLNPASVKEKRLSSRRMPLKPGGRPMSDDKRRGKQGNRRVPEGAVASDGSPSLSLSLSRQG